MIEPTDEMRRAFLAEHDDACDQKGCGRPECLDVRLAAVLAIVERDPGTPRQRLDTAIAEGLPLSGGDVRKRLKQLRKALADLDEVRARQAAMNRGRQ